MTKKTFYSTDGRYRARLVRDTDPSWNPLLDYETFPAILVSYGLGKIDYIGLSSVGAFGVDGETFQNDPLTHIIDSIEDTNPELHEELTDDHFCGLHWLDDLLDRLNIPYAKGMTDRSAELYIIGEQEAADKMGVNPANVQEQLDAELDEAIKFYEGDVWGFIIEEAVGETTVRGKVVDTVYEKTDSCWFLIGEKYALSEMQEAFGEPLDAKNLPLHAK